MFDRIRKAPARLRAWQADRAKWKAVQTRMEHKMPVSRYLFDRWVKRAVTGYVVLCLGFLGNSYIDRQRAQEARAALAQSGNVVSISGCNRDFRLYLTIRQVFQRSLTAATQQHDAGLITDEQFERAKTFYENQLRIFALPDCRDVASILTDKPVKAQKHAPPPQPLYPGSPEAKKLERATTQGG